MSKGVSRQAKPRNINGKTISLTDKQFKQVQAVVNSNTTEDLITQTGEIYNTNNRNTARSILDENLKKPAIQSALDTSLTQSEQVLTGTMTDYGSSDDVNERRLAVDVAKFVHDKVKGKATQRTESVSLSIEAVVDDLHA